MQVSVHQHKLNFTNRDNGWACDGRNLPSGCKSGCTGFNQLHGQDRYRCEPCDYDLCSKCMKAYSIVSFRELPEEVNSVLHHHILKRDYHDNGWACDGKNGTFGCARGCTNFNQSKGWARYRCISCDFDLCDCCALNLYATVPAEKNVIKTSVHGHSLHLLNRDNGWACDGKNLAGGCRNSPPCTGFRQTYGWIRYTCNSCDYDLCKSCATHYTSETQTHNSTSQVTTDSVLPTEKKNVNKAPVLEKSNVAEDNCCCICMDGAKNAVIVHGETSHFCCCFSCADSLKKKNGSCPICRAPIQLVLLCYSS